MKTPPILLSMLLIHSAFAASDRKDNTIILDPISVKNLKIESVTAARQTFESTLFTLGHLAEIPSKRAVLSTRIAGRIVDLKAYIGDEVKQGQTLAILESRQPGNPPPKIELKAPISGIIVETHIKKGQPVEPENELLDITDRSELWAIAHVPEDYVSQIDVGRVANIHIPAIGKENIQSKLLKYSTEADDKNGTLNAIFKINNSEGILRPNLRADFHFITKTKENVLSIPNSALQGTKEKPVVFVKDFEINNAFVKVPVITGESNDNFTEIIQGLFEGDDVITTGSYALNYSSPDSGISLKEALDAAHGHAHNEDGSEMTPEQRATKAKEKAAKEGKTITKSDWKTPAIIGIGFLALAAGQLYWNRKKWE